jgi:hypothetical protein
MELSWSGLGIKKVSASFLKKKKQKNFCFLRALAWSTSKPPVNKSFLLLFFKKEALSFLVLYAAIDLSLAAQAAVAGLLRRLRLLAMTTDGSSPSQQSRGCPHSLA